MLITWAVNLCSLNRCREHSQKPSFCGREIDADLLAELPASCDPCGENGEFHTCVYAGPLWREPLTLARGDRVLRDGRFQFVDLVET